MMRSSMARGWVKACGLSLLVSAGSAALLPGMATAADRNNPQEQQLSVGVGIILRLAEEATKKERWDDALARIRDAQNVKEKTPYDEYQINEFLGYVSSKKGDHATAAEAFQKAFDSGFTPPERVAERARSLAQLNYQAKNYEKAAEYGLKSIEASGDKADPDMYVLVAQAQYLQNDFASAAQTIDKAIALAKTQGEGVKEPWLQIQLTSYSRMQNADGAFKTLQALAMAFPQEKYWEDMLDMLQMQYQKDMRTRLYLYQFMYEVQLMHQGAEYLQMAESASKLGLPGEALVAIEAANKKAIFSSEDEKDYSNKLQEKMRSAADTDRKSLPSLETEAKAAKDGEMDVQLGIAYASYDRYAEAVDAIRRGLTKGGVKSVDEAQIVLGRSLLKLNRTAEAKAEFAKVAPGAQLGTIAQLWNYYSDHKGKLPWMTAEAAAPAAAGS